MYLENFWLGNTRLFIVPLWKLSSFWRSTYILLSQLWLDKEPRKVQILFSGRNACISYVRLFQFIHLSKNKLVICNSGWSAKRRSTEKFNSVIIDWPEVIVQKLVHAISIYCFIWSSDKHPVQYFRKWDYKCPFNRCLIGVSFISSTERNKDGQRI